MVPTELDELCRNFWDANASNYDMSTQEGCGRYTEAFVAYAKKNKYEEVENLKKSGSQTQWNGHAIDAFLYALPYSDTNDLMQAVDIIGSAESDVATYNFGVDEPRYTSADIWQGTSQPPVPDNSVPWVPYDENSFQSLKQILAYDYGRRPQNADFDVSVWSARVFHSAYMGPEKEPLGMDAAIRKHRPEWCAALGVPVVAVPTPK